MKTPLIRLRSINFKIMLALILTLSITPLLTYGYVQTSVRNDLLQQYSSDMQYYLQNQISAINLVYTDILFDMQFLYGVPSLQRLIENPNRVNREEVEKIFAGYSTSHQIFDQVRIIDAEGQEVVRVNSVDGNPVIVPQSELQDKSQRNYFIDAMDLKPEQFLISNFDLNQENDVLEIPYKPTVRIILPLYFDQDSIQGILLVNVLTNKIFDIISEFNTDKTYYVVNDLGDIMFTNASNASEILYASDLGHENTFENVVPLALDQIHSLDYSIDESNGVIYRFASIPFTGVANSKQWYIVVREDLDSISSLVDNTLYGIIGIGILGLMISIIVGVVLTQSITRRLQGLEHATDHLKDEDWEEAIALVSKIKGQDEIGTLATAFGDMLYTLQDVYDRQELLVHERTRELETAHEELRQIDEAKTQLVENIAHDIANPLTAIMMVTTRLRRTPEQYEIVADRIEKQSEQIMALLNKIRDLRSLETLEYKLDESIHLNDVVHTIIERVKPQISNLHIEIAENVEDVPEINGNRLLLERLVENIYVNALKYTFEGKIRIDLHQNREQIVFTVEDTGIGIPEKDIPFIGTRFFRASNTPDKVSGTGIGMGIVQKSAALHGGSVIIESRINVGTTITVNFPLQNTTNATKPA